MKKLLFTAILSLCFLTATPLPVRTATAEPSAGSYACILQENTYFYTAPEDRRGLFLLPTTYYVKLLGYGEEYCHIEYFYDDEQVKKLVGYAKTSALTFVDYLPRQPYYYHEFEVSYRLDDSLIEDSSFLNQITLTCVYYGDYKIGSETYCYVRRGDSFGYVPKPDSLTLPRNTEYEEWLAQQAPPIEEEPLTPQPKSSSPAQIAILIALCLLVPVLAALILKPPRRPPYETDG